MAERLTTSSNPQLGTAVTPDGKAVVFYEVTRTMGRDLMQLALDGTRRVTALLQTKYDELNGSVSPDGRWLAYESNSSGSFEIYVQPFPNAGGGQRQVSTAGGRQPLWSRSGKELVYVGADGALRRVPVEASGGTWNAGTPMKILEGRYLCNEGRREGRRRGARKSERGTVDRRRRACLPDLVTKHCAVWIRPWTRSSPPMQSWKR